jgi:phosphatidylglycerophosphate synthase
MRDAVCHYTLREVNSSLSPEKRRADGPWTKFVLRPLSMPTAWACLRLGIGANAVSYAGAVLGVAGGALMMSGRPWAVWAGLACLFVFGVLDCADGNIARTLKKGSIWGEWVDAVCGYVACTAAILGGGAMAEAQSPGAFPFVSGIALFWSGGWGLVAGLAAAANLYMRLAYGGFRAVRPDPGRQTVSSEKGFSETIGITGALVPALALGYALGATAWVVLAYAIVYTGGAFIISLKLFGKAEADIRASK